MIVLGGCTNAPPPTPKTEVDVSFDPWARIDHWHSDLNQKKADDAALQLETPIGVLSGPVDQDLNARRDLETTVAVADQKLHAQFLADLTTSLTWMEMRNRLLIDLGFPLDSSANKNNPVTWERDAELSARIVLRQQKVAAIAHVLALIANAQTALVKQGADNLQALANSQNSKKAGDAGVANVSSQTNADRAQFVECLLQNVGTAGQDFLTATAQGKQINAAQQKLLAAIQNSKDSSTAFALVAVVGSGLDEGSFDLLNLYLRALKTQLEKLKPPGAAGASSTPVGSTPTTADAAWDATVAQYPRAMDSLNRAVDIVEVEQNIDDAVKRGDVLQHRTPSLEALMRLEASSRPSPAKALGGPAALQPRSIATTTTKSDTVSGILYSVSDNSLTTRLLVKQVGRLQTAANKVPSDWPKSSMRSGPTMPAAIKTNKVAEIPKPAAPGATRFNSPHEEKTDNAKTDAWAVQVSITDRQLAVGQDLAAGITAIKLATDRSNSATKVLRLVTPQVQSQRANLPKTSQLSPSDVLASPPASGSSSCSGLDVKSLLALLKSTSSTQGSTNVAAGFDFLTTLFAAQPALLNTFQKSVNDALAKNGASLLKDSGLTTQDLQFIGGVVKQIAQTQADAKQRVQAFLQELLQVEADLNAENLRHTQAVMTIANLELKRWFTLGMLNFEYEEVFGPQPPIMTGEPGTYPLFDPDDQDAPSWSPLPKTLKSGPYAHPRIRPTDQVYTSVIQLFQTARAWHDAPLSPPPAAAGEQGLPFTTQLNISDRRLYLAIRTVQGHLLMDQLNFKASEDNTIRLTGELALHDNQLDDFHARVEESGLHLTLGSVKAFHDSGVTDGDVQSALQAIQDVFVGIIATSKVK
jgi:hypothetical protein